MDMVEKKELSAGHARALVPILDSAKQLDAAREVVRRSLSVRQTELLAGRLLRQPKKTSAGEPPLVDYAAEVSDELSRILGRKVRLSEGRKGGRIELEYYDADDREKLIADLRETGKAKSVTGEK